MKPLIEKKLAEFYGLPKAWVDTDNVEITHAMVVDFLRTALEEAIVQGVELAEGVVPPVNEIRSGLGRLFDSCVGFQECRTETLSRLAALKKEVVDRKV